MSENAKVLRFAIIVCLVCSVLISAAAIGLRDRQEANLQRDIQKNILKSVGLVDPSSTPEQIGATYAERISGIVLTPDGTVIEGRKPDDVDPEKEPELLRLYQRVDDGQVVAYSFPIVGKGLWSTLYGYFALESDLNTVKGITFYKQGETPGLGAEIEKPWFQDNFVGKKILAEDGSIASVKVVKGKAADVHPNDTEHYVDGISGATITATGVTEMVGRTIRQYEPYFAKLRGQGRGKTS